MGLMWLWKASVQRRNIIEHNIVHKVRKALLVKTRGKLVQRTTLVEPHQLFLGNHTSEVEVCTPPHCCPLFPSTNILRQVVSIQ